MAASERPGVVRGRATVTGREEERTPKNNAPVPGPGDTVGQPRLFTAEEVEILCQRRAVLELLRMTEEQVQQAIASGDKRWRTTTLPDDD